MARLERLTDLVSVDTAAGPWRDLLEQYPAAGIFSTPEWLGVWCRCFGRNSQPWVQVVRDSSEVRGILPLVRTREWWGTRRVRILRFPTDVRVSVARGDLIAPADRQECVDAMVRDWESTAGQWDVILLDAIPEASPALEILTRTLERSPRLQISRGMVWSLYYLPLKVGWEEYLGRLHASTRQNVRREYRLLQALGEVRLETVRSPEEMSAAVEGVYSLERRSGKRTRPDYIWPCRRARLFFRELSQVLARKGECEVTFLRLDRQPIAAQLAILHRRVQTLLMTYFDRRLARVSAGQVLKRCLIEAAMERGLYELDFNGREAHQARWTSLGRHFVQLAIAARGVEGSRLAQEGLRRIDPAVITAPTLWRRARARWYRGARS